MAEVYSAKLLGELRSVDLSVATLATLVGVGTKLLLLLLLRTPRKQARNLRHQVD